MWQERRKIKKGSQKILKRLTVVCLHLNVYAVPKRKVRDKLVEEARVKGILLEEDHDEQVVTGKIVKLFPKLLSQENSPQFHYMYATSSGDIRAELPEGHTGWDGEAVCCIADGNNVYIKPAFSHTSVQVVDSAPTPVHPQQNPPPVPVPVHPQQNPPPVPVHSWQNLLLGGFCTNTSPPLTEPSTSAIPQPVHSYKNQCQSILLHWCQATHLFLTLTHSSWYTVHGWP